jgi:glutaconate CoA-transferase subunit B
MNFTTQEMMVISTGREIRDGELCIFGVGLSMLAGYFAVKNHGPNIKAMTEGGVFGATPVGGLPWGIEDNRIAANAVSFTGPIDALGFLVASGRCDVGIIGGAAVDKFGNVNTTAFWHEKPGSNPPPPKLRLSGSGVANDIACGCKRFLIMMTHEKKRFPNKIDYISSPGYLNGGEDRKRHPFAGGGPAAIITTLGIMRPDPQTKEFMISSYHSFSSIEAMQENTGWELKVAPDVCVTPVPSQNELENLRAVDVTGFLKKQ